MQNIGERLEEARKSKGISIREAAEATKVRGDYLHKFESNQFDINLPEIYVRGFLRNYATYLGLSAEKVVNDYNALGHGKPEPKTMNREIYGRMDITVGNGPRDNAPEPNDGESGDEEHETAEENPATFTPQSSSLPSLDKPLIIRGLLALGGLVVVILLIVLTVKALTGDEEETAPTTETTAVAPAAGNDVIIHALDTVRIKVVDEVSGEELFQGSISRGGSRAFPKTDSMLLTADPIENVEVEINGTRHPTGLTGRDRIRIQ
jgi:transcriptional regulator with XRE-family HTH domain